MNRRLLFARVLFSFFATTADAFLPTQRLPFDVEGQLPRRVSLNGESSASSEKSETLIFNADFDCASDPFPVTSKKTLIEFFQKPSTRDLFLSAGGKRSAREELITPVLLDLWKRSCQEFYGDEYLPEATDILIASESDVSFPGLTLVTTACSGAKIYRDADTSLPVYEFVMIADKLDARGPKPIKYLFNQLTGRDGAADVDFGPSNTRAKSKVSIAEMGSGQYAFQLNVAFETRVDFPKILVKILPTTKEKMEEQGSASILKTVKSDVEAAVAETRNAFLVASSS